MSKISWKDFENTCPNPQVDFEELCRIFFKYHFVKDKYVNLPQKKNNPGIETEPVLIGEEYVGFQAKYFAKKVSYTDIFKSAQTTISYYKERINKVILFCNQDIDITAKDYKQAEKELRNNGIEIEPFSNANIIDAINTIEEYSTIKALFFKKLHLSDDWFNRRLSIELKDLEPRYVTGFHVPLDIEKHFEIAYQSDAMFYMLKELIKEWKNILKDIYKTPDYIKTKILSKLNSLVIPNKSNIEDILKWHEPFIEIKEELDKLYNGINDKWQKVISGEMIVEKSQQDGIINELNIYRKLLDLLAAIDLSKNEYFKCINKNIFIIEGDAGTGKSHILGYETETHGNNDKYRSVLLLGQKMIINDVPSVQIMKALDLANNDFDDFLDSCEAKGEITGCITVIMLDAINECDNHNIWKNYLNEILQKIQVYKYVRLICSIRSTYKDVIFNEALKSEINNGTIPLIRHDGFRNILSTAIPEFFNHYKIPISIAPYLDTEFENPLFLKTYCEGFIKGMKFGSNSVFSLYKNYLKKEEDKIKYSLKITDDYPYIGDIFDIIGEYFYNNNTARISYRDLIKATKSIPKHNEFVDKLLKAKVLISYYHNENMQVYISYERFIDFVVAKHIINKTKNVNDLKDWVKSNLLLVDKYGRLTRLTAVGIFATLSILAKEKYNEEIIDCIQAVPETDKYGYYLRSNLIIEYINSFKYRADLDINDKSYFDYVFPFIKTKVVFEKHIDLLLTMAGRNNQLNANTLTNWLMRLPLVKRDYLWTLYINDRYEEGERIYNTINHFLFNDLSIVTHQERLLYGQEITWFFTSSNRLLRDKASRALIRLLSDDINSMNKLLDVFVNANDPYVSSRLFGCVYGAILHIELEKLNKPDLINLTTWIFDNIFSAEEVYTDILLRDYALNIIEYTAYLGLEFNFDIKECRPPYKSREIKAISIDTLKELYPERDYEKDKRWLGTDSIKWSLAPEYGIEDFCRGYGDFGRYTFGSSLSDFKSINEEYIFSYAYDYIINELGYDNKLFSEYDKRIGSGRGRPNAHLERIGKKYQWITMYHTLALVSDNYPFDEKYSDIEFNEYKGTWRPYVRDFDPTLDLINNNRKYELPFFITQPNYKDWDNENKEWVDIKDKGNIFKEYVEIKDNKCQNWIFLHGHIKHKSVEGYDSDYRQIWKMISAYCINELEYNNFINKIKNTPFWGRWFPEAHSKYNIFSKEYCWSPAYKDEFSYSRYEEIEIDTGKEELVEEKCQELLYVNAEGKELIYDDFIENIENQLCQTKIVMRKRQINKKIKENIGSVMPCWEEYLWEEEYDFSKEESVSYYLPCGPIVTYLNLSQKENGLWSNNDDIVAFDSSLIKGNTIGLYIRKDYLIKYLKDNKLKLFWVGIGERNDCKNDNKFRAGNSKYRDMSSLMYYDDIGDIISIDKFGERM